MATEWSGTPRGIRRPLKRIAAKSRLATPIVFDRPGSQGFAIIDNFGSSIPVSTKELEVIETYLIRILDLEKSTDDPQIDK